MSAKPPSPVAGRARRGLLLAAGCVPLLAGAGNAGAQGADGLLMAVRTDTIVADAQRPLDCKTYTPEALGFQLAGKVEARADHDPRLTFRIQIYRVAVPAAKDAATAGAAPAYRDYVMAGHYWNEAAVQATQAFLTSQGVDSRAIVAALPCTYGGEKEVLLYAPLASSDGGSWFVAPQLQPFRFDVVAKPVRGGNKEMSPQAAAGEDDGKEKEEEKEKKEEASADAVAAPAAPYAWTSASLVKRLAASEDVFVLDRYECDEKGHFFIGSTAEIVGTPPADLALPVEVTRTTMYALANHVGASGGTVDRAAVEASVDPTHYWCIPKQEFCYKKIKFGQFGVPASAGETKQVPRDAVYNLRLGMVAAIQQITLDHCTEGAKPK